MSEYEGREQSLVKHFILKKYLERFAHVIFSRYSTITYVDCFSGPWNVRAEDFSDSSFAIALKELRTARETWRPKHPDRAIRCFFLEKDRDAYQHLDAFARSITDATIATQNARLEHAISDILRFVDDGGHNSFPFFLIDPTGWTGFELDVIEPLLKRQPSEVLINLMTSFIRRFIKSPDPETQRSFERTFGKYKPSLQSLQALSEEDLDDAIVHAYCNLVRDTGKYAYVSNAIVLHPDIDSTHFRLIYATRSLKGIDVFKKVEKDAMSVQGEIRARVRAKKREQKEGPLLFAPEAFGTNHFNRLRTRYLSAARSEVVRLMNGTEELSYDSLYAAALAYPAVWDSDLKGWIADWCDSQFISLVGLGQGQRVPQHSQQIRVKRLKPIHGI